MTLHWGSEHVSKCLPAELVDRLSEAYADPSLTPDAVTGLPIYNGKTGDLLMEMKAEKPCRVSRRKLRNLFAEGLDVQYGKEVADVIEEGEDRVRVVFKDGTEVVGDVVIGCDGARSRVRECICGEEQAQLKTVPLSMLNFTSQFTAEQSLYLRKLNPLFITSIHPDHGTMFWISSKLFSHYFPFQSTLLPRNPNTDLFVTVQDVPDPSRPETWTYQLLMSWVNNPLPSSQNTYEGRLAYFKQRAQEYAEPWRLAGQWVKDDAKIPLDPGTYWEKAAKWDNRKGRMTLGGDAAHPMTPRK
jgi:2-polyprenyl-6-methoxyphenol hydroxylase-like FAD-dependent oxidoreductase